MPQFTMKDGKDHRLWFYFIIGPGERKCCTREGLEYVFAAFRLLKGETRERQLSRVNTVLLQEESGSSLYSLNTL